MSSKGWTVKEKGVALSVLGPKGSPYGLPFPPSQLKMIE